MKLVHADAKKVKNVLVKKNVLVVAVKVVLVLKTIVNVVAKKGKNVLVTVLKTKNNRLFYFDLCYYDSILSV
jgi:hypothetical protein